jgi:phosphatidylglycerol:prolipoprotein diacylglycerol transferase
MSLALIPYPQVEPVLFEYGPLVIRWYALAYVAGILLGWLYARAIIGRARLWGGKAPLIPDDMDDFMLWATLGVVVGGRLGDVLIYEWPYYAAHPREIVEIWHGGMAFHGGLIGVAIAGLLFARWRRIPVLSLGDVVCVVAPIGLFFGRIANFINDELWGRPSNVPWAMVFPDAGPIPRHPSQLYEAGLEGLVLFVVLALVVRAGGLKRPGLAFGVFLAGYGITRTIAEFFRAPDPQLEKLNHGFTMGMLLSMPMIVIGLAFVVFALRRKPRDTLATP